MDRALRRGGRLGLGPEDQHRRDAGGQGQVRLAGQHEKISLHRLINAMTLRPAEILGLPQGRLVRGAPADLIRFDPDEPFVVDAAKLRSRSKNTPFDDARLEGVVKATMVAGRVLAV